MAFNQHAFLKLKTKEKYLVGFGDVRHGKSIAIPTRSCIVLRVSMSDLSEVSSLWEGASFSVAVGAFFGFNILHDPRHLLQKTCG